MADRSITPTTSLELLLHEIEATPKEYWTDLLDTLRQFRQKIPSATSPIVIFCRQSDRSVVTPILRSQLLR
jgi:hypothetical protein